MRAEGMEERGAGFSPSAKIKIFNAEDREEHRVMLESKGIADAFS